ncbi:unnamed protein product [Didymodactylos carnosus]|uniref:Uncharacterized protein n=1 Tax=Didymodactylos carnosus TaxID=1234261 RepID=A0A813NEX4_9BILA|nr:unnamed protein product [Didymodactylos carnosus]CAF3516968.1 unnamed protein product [Didymodactylos carnosus]
MIMTNYVNILRYLLLLQIGSIAIQDDQFLTKECNKLKCDNSTEYCRVKTDCYEVNSNCVYCEKRTNDIEHLSSSNNQQQEPSPIANRLLAKSRTKLLADNRNPISSATIKTTTKVSQEYEDEYLTYDDQEDDEFGEEDDYLDDYNINIETSLDNNLPLIPVKKPGVCPKVDKTIKLNNRDSCKSFAECRFDTDCSAELKCCENNCGTRSCLTPTETKTASVCSQSLNCSLNCSLGYQTDRDGCLICECQSCPPMIGCNKNCPQGYLKDLFGCSICECSDQCPNFVCNLDCSNGGFEQSDTGCPLCRCNQIDYTQCQQDVHCPPGFKCVNERSPQCFAIDGFKCPIIQTCKAIQAVSCVDIRKKCSIKCLNDKYQLDNNGCEVCACPMPIRPSECPQVKCRSTCESGYEYDNDGCQTCRCATDILIPKLPEPWPNNDNKKDEIECSKIQCRMHCQHGFKKNEYGCEICLCNDAPQLTQQCPMVACNTQCSNGYKKDSNGCVTCTCNDQKTDIETFDDPCPPLQCNQNCKYGYERDTFGCQLCSCNKCPLHTCRMFCPYGFKKNEDGCDKCDCDWTPIIDQIPCSLRDPCGPNYVCNLDLLTCEAVSSDKINYFVYNFEVKTFFNDKSFLNTFKNGFIQNVASKYELMPPQILVTRVETDGQTEFQVMPYFQEDKDDFQKKMDQIDADMQNQAFQSVLPSVANNNKWQRPGIPRPYSSLWQRNRLIIILTGLLLTLVALIVVTVFFIVFRHRLRHTVRSEHDQFAVHAPDGTAYVVVESEDIQAPSDKRALV